MKKTIIVLIVIIATLFGTKTIIGVQAIRSATESILEAPPLKTRQIALQKDSPILPESRLLDVPLINQMDKPLLYNGCEVTSLAMVMQYNGIKVTKNELAENIKTVPFTYRNGLKGNPNTGFVGDMAHGPGLGVYNGPVYELAKKYAGERAINLTGSPFTDLLKKVNQGHPVWIITTVNYAPVNVFQTWNTPEGKIDITFSEHSVVITGYDQSYIYINDPYGTKNKKLNRENFINAWEQMGKQAIVIQ